MDLQLQGKHILITGGSKGIGLSCAQGFLAEGARVTLVSRSADNLERARTALARDFPNAAVHTIAADLRDAAQAQRALDEAEAHGGAVDVLVTSAGAAKRTPPDELNPQVWADAMQAKYFSYINILDPMVKRMGQRGRGVVVNVVGAGGKFPTPIHMPGGAANAALMLASAGLAAVYAPKGVRINVINPGLTLTERLREGMAADARLNGISVDEAMQRANERLPLRRLATPEEIADAVLYLASPRASYVTGAVLAMDGAANPVIL